jgi:hypothetical protein
MVLKAFTSAEKLFSGLASKSDAMVKMWESCKRFGTLLTKVGVLPRSMEKFGPGRQQTPDSSGKPDGAELPAMSNQTTTVSSIPALSFHSNEWAILQIPQTPRTGNTQATLFLNGANINANDAWDPLDFTFGPRELEALMSFGGNWGYI